MLMNIISLQHVIEKNTKLSKQQIESAYKHIHSLKNAARSIQLPPPSIHGVTQGEITKRDTVPFWYFSALEKQRLKTLSLIENFNIFTIDCVFPSEFFEGIIAVAPKSANSFL